MKDKLLIDLHIPIQPVPKERPYLSGKKVFTRDKTRKSEEDIAMFVKSHMQLNKITKTFNLLYVESMFVFPPRVVKKSNARAFENIYPRRPDLDNLQKLLYDALNGIIYHDDCQIILSMAGKMYEDVSRKMGIYLKITEYYTDD